MCVGVCYAPFITNREHQVKLLEICLCSSLTAYRLAWQAEIGDKIDGVEALEQKLLQRLNFAASVMKNAATNLEDGILGYLSLMCRLRI